jgi:hypothetical protein
MHDTLLNVDLDEVGIMHMITTYLGFQWRRPVTTRTWDNNKVVSHSSLGTTLSVVGLIYVLLDGCYLVDLSHAGSGRMITTL